MLKSLSSFLFKNIPSSTVGIFRIIFGLFMTYQILYYYSIDYIYQFISGPEILFPYHGFEFITSLPNHILKILQLGLLASSILITIGYLYRVAAIYFTLVFTYFSFIDNTLYNNHLYLICLISFSLIFIHGDASFSLKKEKREFIPAWNQYILMFLIALPYFFGGIAKLSPNWLSSDLTKIFLSNTILNQSPNLLNWISPFIKYGGLIYDLSIVFLLLNKKTFKLGLILVLIFNLTNHFFIFDDIGLFPFLMIFSTILFFPNSLIQSIVNKLRFFKQPKRKKKLVSNTFITEKAIELKTVAISLFVLFHLLFPFRHLLHSGNPEWTGNGVRFAWRMKMHSRKIIDSKMTVIQKGNNQSVDIDPSTYLSANQWLHLTELPYNLVHLSKYVSKKASNLYIYPPQK